MYLDNRSKPREFQGHRSSLLFLLLLLLLLPGVHVVSMYRALGLPGPEHRRGAHFSHVPGEGQGQALPQPHGNTQTGQDGDGRGLV